MKKTTTPIAALLRGKIMQQAPIRVLACSPRARGNSDFIVHNFVQGVRNAGGKVEVTFLREHSILPCTVCHACFDDANNKCILSIRDDADIIFAQIEQAPLVFIAAPIFFYHLPAQLKAFLDRAQCYWAKREKLIKAGEYKPNPNPKPAMAGLVAARTRGDKLFEGSILTLQYFLDLFDIKLQETCQMFGYDGPDELAADGVACSRFFELGTRAQAMVVESIGARNLML